MTWTPRKADRTITKINLGRKAVWSGDSTIDPTVPRTTASQYTSRSQRSAERQYLTSMRGRNHNVASDLTTPARTVLEKALGVTSL